jgi:hypothetical protein
LQYNKTSNRKDTIFKKGKKTMRDPEVIADAFNTYFLKITDKLSLHKEGRGDAISFLRKEIPRKIPGIDHPNN